MDSIKSEKLQPLKKYKKNAHFLDNLILYSLSALICTLFCSYTLRFPPPFSSLSHFFFVSIPKFTSFFFSTKCLFIVGNLIIIVLVGESKFASSFSPPATEIYDEFVERSQSLRAASMLREKKSVKEVNPIYEAYVVMPSGEGLNVIPEEKYIAEKEKEEEMKDDNGEDGEEEREEDSAGLPVEELNRRVEDFIARVNGQRWLEDKLLVCGRA